MKATLQQPEIVVRKGKPVSVILPIEIYQELLERLEDADDMEWLKKARQKPMRYRPLKEYLAQRKAKSPIESIPRKFCGKGLAAARPQNS